MAITLAFTTKQGVACATPYIVIASVSYNKIPSKSFISPSTVPDTTGYASVYYNSAAYTAQNDPLQTIMFQFNANTSTTAAPLHTQAYNALKALPEMTGAIDC